MIPPDPFVAASLLNRFRRHPDAPGIWLFREEWPFRGVWALAGGVPVDADTRIFFQYHTLNVLEALTNPIGAMTVFALALNRRRWLKRHARRETAAVWRRAA